MVIISGLNILNRTYDATHQGEVVETTGALIL